MRIRIFLLWITSLTVLSCGGAQKKTSLDAMTLLREGKYEEAKTVASSKINPTPEDNGIIAIATLALDTTDTGMKSAIAVLTSDNNEVAAALGATQMLSLGFEIPQVPNPQFDFILCETALGAAGYGKNAVLRVNPVSGSSVSRTLAVAVLERLSIWLSTYSTTIETGRLVEIWNGCYSLLGGSMAAESEYQAWRLFTSIGSISISLWNDKKRDTFSNVLVQSAIAVIENNPQIAIAAKCDLSSPYEKLRSTIAGRRKLLGSLERAVSAAIGCTRGKYAPTKE